MPLEWGGGVTIQLRGENFNSVGGPGAACTLAGVGLQRFQRTSVGTRAVSDYNGWDYSGFRLQQLGTVSTCRFRGGLVFKAHRLVYHSTLGLRVKKRENSAPGAALRRVQCAPWRGWRRRAPGGRGLFINSQTRQRAKSNDM